MKPFSAAAAALFVAVALASCGSSSPDRGSATAGQSAGAPTDRTDMDLGRPLWRKR